MRNLIKTTIAILTLTCALHASAQASDRGYWQAASNAASSITGDIDITATKITIDFKNYTIAPIRTIKPEEVSAVFDADVNTAGSGSLYRLNVPGAQRFLHKNTLCGSEDTQWMVTYVGDKFLQVAFFSGNAAPTLTFDAVSHSTDLCGVYNYAR
jgi:hypothetical protein